jgi:hypothetical protein
MILDGGAIPGAESSELIITANGIYTVQVTDANGCQGISAEFQITTATLVQPGSTLDLLNVFPNPFSEVLTVRLDENAPKIRVELLNSLGQLVFFEQATGNQLRIKTAELPAGIYLLRVQENVAVRSRVVVKE